jgi:hypothetical protein
MRNVLVACAVIACVFVSLLIVQSRPVLFLRAAANVTAARGLAMPPLSSVESARDEPEIAAAVNLSADASDDVVTPRGSSDSAPSGAGLVPSGPARELTDGEIVRTVMYTPKTLLRSLAPIADAQAEVARHEAIFAHLPPTREDVRYHSETPPTDGQAAVDAMAAKYSRVGTAGELEFVKVPPVLLYMRPDVGARWRELEAAEAARIGPGKRGRSVVRVACLFAGFVRDYERMINKCTDVASRRKCLDSTIAKFYGNLRANILEGMNCDVYASTWNIRGKGRFNVYSYDMTQAVPLDQLQKAYGGQLAGLHVQNYSMYEPVWKYMHKFARGFPQTRPTKLFVNRRAGTASFAGVPELNFLMRQNDYSQSYKHWCVVQLALLSQFPYDAFYRMRFDLRAVGRLHSLHFAVDGATGDKTIQFGIARGAEAESGAAASSHFISARRIHAHNFDISDFGFFGPARMIEHLASLWFYCLAPAGKALQAGAPITQAVDSLVISEYNYMLWRIIFDNHWSVDSGNRYLYASRRFGTRQK